MDEEQREAPNAEERLERIEKAMKSIADSFSRSGSRGYTPEPDPPNWPPRGPFPTPTPGPRPGPESVKLAAAAGVTGSALVSKLMNFAAGLDERELRELEVLFAPAIAAAKEAGINPMKRDHSVAFDYLRELDIRLERGRLVGGPGDVAIGPTVTTVTITTTVASHPIITCD